MKHFLTFKFNQHSLKLVLLFPAFILCMSYWPLQAQHVVNSSGGDISGAGGSASYSAGQVAYNTHYDAGGTVSEGVQQAYEIYVSVEEEFDNMALKCRVYPNPAKNRLNIKLENFSHDPVFYQFYDLNGRFISSREKLKQSKTELDITHIPQGIYYLRIYNNTKVIKSFKIIKTK